MEAIFEIVLQVLGELLLQIFFEFLAELGVRSLAEPFRMPRHPVLSTIGFVIWGAAAGGISLLILPRSLISNLAFRKINILVTPLVAGGIMMMIGRQRGKRGQRLVGLDRFGYAFLFALVMAVVRYIWAK